MPGNKTAGLAATIKDQDLGSARNLMQQKDEKTRIFFHTG
jgi:hypothetical protein